MKNIVVVDDPGRWSLVLPDAEVVSARAYLSEARWSRLRRVAVFNLCGSYAYQSEGYYVSLLAAARGHRPLPSVETLQDLRLPGLVRILSDELDALIQRSLRHLEGDRFELSIYFGANLARRHERVARVLFNQFPAPFLRASFARADVWTLRGLRLLPGREIPESHLPFVQQEAARFLSRPHRTPARRAWRYDLAILVDETAEDQPSDEGALRRFERAAEREGMRVERIGREDAGRLGEFDALFLRETTRMDHHTYRLARRAAAEGLVVIDDPESIVRCTNKVYQAELFARHDIPRPETLLVHHTDDAAAVEASIGLPCVLKQPDGSFSRGVVKAETRDQLEDALGKLLADSALVVAQRFVPSSFDWRVGVLGGRALFACRYHMVPGEWRVVDYGRGRHRRYGKVDALPLDRVPPRALELARQAAGLIGTGFYGVDLKQTADDDFIVLEVNDNPNVDANCEDAELKDGLYTAVMRHFRERLDARGREDPCG